MHRKCILPALIGMILIPFLGGCLQQEHPNYDRYEYLFIDGAFQAPYKEFPTGADRIHWKCYDTRANRAFDCTFVHGGWELYRYVYRPRT